jgi:hypothetical protein
MSAQANVNSRRSYISVPIHHRTLWCAIPSCVCLSTFSLGYDFANICAAIQRNFLSQITEKKLIFLVSI